MTNSDLKAVANDTLALLEREPLAALTTRAKSRTELVRPQATPSPQQRFEKTRITLVDATTSEAAKDMGEGVLALNFASGWEVGGGFLRGAVAQEEDLCRCSGLYPCLLTQPEYYDANRKDGTAFFTDLMIYSPSVPFFRDRTLEVIPEPFLVSILTAPAPIASQTNDQARVEATLRSRSQLILSAAMRYGHSKLVLGAWGCGAFRNDPEIVADAFAVALTNEPFAHAFSDICFAIYRGGANLKAFEKRF